jgi:hypothetical protein
MGTRDARSAEEGEDDIIAAAVQTYRASIETAGHCPSASWDEMFGKTSRRRARSRMAEDLRSLVTFTAEGRVAVLGRIISSGIRSDRSSAGSAVDRSQTVVAILVC